MAELGTMKGGVFYEKAVDCSAACSFHDDHDSKRNISCNSGRSYTYFFRLNSHM